VAEVSLKNIHKIFGHLNFNNLCRMML